MTAAIPLLGLAGAFHYWQWLPPYFSEGAWVSAGVEKFGRYFRNKGWITEADETNLEEEAYKDKLGHESEGRSSRKGNSTRLIIEFATAYAIVKALLPLRLLVSVSASPWFARMVVVPAGTITAAVFRKTKAPS
jgi:hypothetical protein